LIFEPRQGAFLYYSREAGEQPRTFTTDIEAMEYLIRREQARQARHPVPQQDEYDEAKELIRVGDIDFGPDNMKGPREYGMRCPNCDDTHIAIEGDLEGESHFVCSTCGREWGWLDGRDEAKKEIDFGNVERTPKGKVARCPQCGSLNVWKNRYGNYGCMDCGLVVGKDFPGFDENIAS